MHLHAKMPAPVEAGHIVYLDGLYGLDVANCADLSAPAQCGVRGIFFEDKGFRVEGEVILRDPTMRGRVV